MVRLGIIAALPFEARSLKAQLPSHILVQQCGPGGQRAEQAAERLVRVGAHALLSWGCAGALCPDMAAGEVVLPLTVVDFQGRSFASDDRWHEHLFACMPAELCVHVGTLASSPAVLTDENKKTSWRDRYHAIAVDMESAAIAAVACRHGLPFMALRVIADTLATSIPAAAIQALDARGRISLPAGLRLLLHAGAWPSLLRLARNGRAAQRSLKRLALTTALTTLPSD